METTHQFDGMMEICDPYQLNDSRGPPEADQNPPYPLDDDSSYIPDGIIGHSAPMPTPSSAASETSATVEPNIVIRRPRDIQERFAAELPGDIPPRTRNITYESPESFEMFSRGKDQPRKPQDNQPRRGLQTHSQPKPTKSIMELSQLDMKMPFYKKVQRLFHEKWHDQNKICHVKAIYLFDVKTLQDSYRLADSVTSSDDAELVSSLESLSLCFHGSRRACRLGDQGEPLEPCRSDKCSICTVFRDQYKLMKTNLGSIPSLAISTSTISSEADVFANNHHIRSHQHAMILCAAPAGRPDESRAELTAPSHTSQSAQPNTRHQGKLSKHPKTSSSRQAVVPIGLVMYTRKGWQPTQG